MNFVTFFHPRLSGFDGEKRSQKSGCLWRRLPLFCFSPRAGDVNQKNPEKKNKRKRESNPKRTTGRDLEFFET